MFWIGILIALAGGLLSVGLSRDKAKQRHRTIKDWHLDIAALVLLVLGLVVSAVDHIAYEHQAAALLSEVQRIHSFEVIIATTASAHWTGKQSPDLIPIGFDQTKSLAALDLETRPNTVRHLELIPWLAPKLSPAKSGSVTLLLHLRPRSEDWVYTTQVTELLGTKRVEFGTWGLTRSLTTDGRLYIADVTVEIFINGKPVAHIRKVADKWIELPQQSTRYGTLSWDELHSFQQIP